MPPSYLIYHPKRNSTPVGDLTIHHDPFGGNEDPYLWHDQFLHTYCHTPQLSNVEGQLNFWVSGDAYPDFKHLWCDCVFLVKEKHFWKERNSIESTDPIVDSPQAFEHHYKWAAEGHHPYRRRRRYTLKADPLKSFQPQDGKGNLLDILPFLEERGISRKQLIEEITTKRNSRPFRLPDEVGAQLYDFLQKRAERLLFGHQLRDKHPHRVSAAKTTHPRC